MLINSSLVFGNSNSCIFVPTNLNLSFIVITLMILLGFIKLF